MTIFLLNLALCIFFGWMVAMFFLPILLTYSRNVSLSPAMLDFGVDSQNPTSSKHVTVLKKIQNTRKSIMSGFYGARGFFCSTHCAGLDCVESIRLTWLFFLPKMKCCAKHMNLKQCCFMLRAWAENQWSQLKPKTGEKTWSSLKMSCFHMAPSEGSRTKESGLYILTWQVSGSMNDVTWCAQLFHTCIFDCKQRKQAF